MADKKPKTIPPPGRAGGVQVLRALQRVRAAMSQDQMLELDRQFMSGSYGVARRFGLGVYTISGKHLIDQIKSNRTTAVAFAVAADRIEECVKATRTLADDLERAAWRMRVALCTREDMETVIAESRKQDVPLR